MDFNRVLAFLKKIVSLTNFWPALMVGIAVMLAIPHTVPALKSLPERLQLTQVSSAEEKPTLPEFADEGATEAVLADSGNTYKDGVFTGSSNGYGGKITVQVTVAEGKITAVSVVSAPGETSSFLSKAKGVIDRVIQAQTWEVDVVSGATFSSRGILGAIKNAITGETVENAEPPEQEGPIAPVSEVPFDDSAVWKDGVYIGSARGYGGTIKVEVTVKTAKISKIRVLEHGGESSSYFNKAKKVIKKIIAAGTPNVDTISGATYSSSGIINAVKNALKKAAGAKAEDPVPAAPAQDNEKVEEPDLANGLKDGKYSTDVVCTDNNIFEYTIRVTMVVKDGKITSLTAVRMNDKSDNPDMNKTYLGYAISGRTEGAKTHQGIIYQVMKLQTTKDVDVVSGATYSSKAILKGIRTLLKQAAKNPADNTEEDEEEAPDNDPEKKNPAADDDDDEEEEENIEGLKDGTYTAKVDCTDNSDDPLFDYTLKITAVIKEGRITSINVERVSDNSDDPETNLNYIDYAIKGRTRKGVEYKGVIEQILAAQSTKDVDVVSGATYSSKAILRGVRDILKQAAVNPDDIEETDPENTDSTDDPADDPADDPSDDPSEEKDPEETDPEDENALLKDGTYVKEAECCDYPDYPTFDYTVKTTTVIEGGKVVSIDVERTNDNSEDPDANAIYLGYAVNGRTRKNTEYPSVISQILNKQGTSGVDVVSGATYSSKAIINSVREAFKEAGYSSAEEGSGTGNTGEEGSGTGNTGEEGSGTGNTGEEGSGTGNTGEEGSGTGNTGEEGSGTGNTGEEGSGTGNTGEEGSGTGGDSGETESGDAALKDGTYEKEAECIDNFPSYPLFYYVVKTTTVIKGGKIVSIDVTRTKDYSDEPETNEIYLNYAAKGRTWKGVTYTGIIAQILDKQGTSDVDIVSSATYSSNAILKSIREALQEAAVEENSEIGKTGESAEAGKTGESAEAGKTGESAEAGKTGESAEAGKTVEESSSGEKGKEESKAANAESGKTAEGADADKTEESTEAGKTGDSAVEGKSGENAEAGKTGESAVEGKTGESAEAGKTGESAGAGKTGKDAEADKTAEKDSNGEKSKKESSESGKSKEESSESGKTVEGTKAGKTGKDAEADKTAEKDSNGEKSKEENSESGKSKEESSESEKTVEGTKAGKTGKDAEADKTAEKDSNGEKSKEDSSDTEKSKEERSNSSDSGEEKEKAQKAKEEKEKAEKEKAEKEKAEKEKAEKEKKEKEEEEKKKNTNKYLDGTYSGTATCKGDSFKYKIKVEIKIKDGKIKDVSVKKKDDESEDPKGNEKYFKYAAKGRDHSTGIPKQIKENQSASDLDAVSGATQSSKAMKKAAKEALSDARNPDA